MDPILSIIINLIKIDLGYNQIKTFYHVTATYVSTYQEIKLYDIRILTAGYVSLWSHSLLHASISNSLDNLKRNVTINVHFGNKILMAHILCSDRVTPGLPLSEMHIIRLLNSMRLWH